MKNLPSCSGDLFSIIPCYEGTIEDICRTLADLHSDGTAGYRKRHATMVLNGVKPPEKFKRVVKEKDLCSAGGECIAGLGVSLRFR